MDSRFAAYNTHHYNPEQFWENDPQLRMLKNQPYLYQHPVIQQLPITTPGIYTIGGGRQIGKTTLLKQWIASLISSGIPANTIFFITGELIDDHHALVDLLHDLTSNSPHHNEKLYIIIDEITYIKEWDKGIKFAADAGYLHNCILILTGSDLSLMQSARMTFPGRRGKADKVDFHIYPLSFKELVLLKKPIDIEIFNQNPNVIDNTSLDILYNEFTEYLKHGGYLTAINDIASNGCIAQATLKTYSDWIRGDMQKRGKQEHYLKEILDALIKRYNKQVTWHNLADAISIDSHKTIADYCQLLATMDALFIQSALLEDKLVASPKKARKLTFTDPFIYHAIKQWIYPSEDPNHQINNDIENPIISSDLVEAVVSNQYHRHFPTYYLKSEGEIDVAYVTNKTFWPIEVKWRNQIRPKDIKQISKYQRGKIFAKTHQPRTINKVPIIPLPLALITAENVLP